MKPTYKTYLLLLALLIGVFCHVVAKSAIVVVEFVPPTNAVAAGIHDYTLTARTIGTNQIDQWLAAPLLGSTNCEFESSNLPAIPCMLSMRSNGTNGQTSAYCDWILFDTNTAIVTTNSPQVILPPSLIRWHFK